MMAGKDDKMERSDIETIANVDHSHSVKDYFRYDEFLQSTGGGGGQAVSGWGSPAKGATWGDNTAGGGGGGAGGGGGGGVGGSDQMAKTTSNAPEDNCNEDGAWGTSTLNLGIVKPPSQFDWPPPGGNSGANSVVGASKVPKGGEGPGGIEGGIGGVGGGQASDNPNGSVNLNQVVKQQQQQQQEPSTGESEAAAVPVAPASAAKNQLNQLRDALYAYEGWGKDHVNQETQWEVALSPTKSLEVSGGVEAPTGTELWHMTKSGKTVVQQTGEGEERGTTMWGHVPSSNFGGTWGDNSEIDEGGGGGSVWPTTPSMPVTREFQWGIVEGIPPVNKAPGAAVVPPPPSAAPSVIDADTGALGGNIWSTGPGIPGAAGGPGGAAGPGGAWNDSRADSMIRGGVTGRLNLMDNNPSKAPGWGDDPLVQLPPTQPSTSFWSQHQPPQAVQAAPQPTTGAVSWNHDIPDVSGVRSRLAPGPMQPPPNLNPDRFPGKPDTNPWGQGITKNGLWDQMGGDRPTPESQATGGLWGKSAGGNKGGAGGAGGGGVWADPGDYRNWTPNGQAAAHFNVPNGMNKFAIGSGNRMGGTNKVQEIIRSSKQFRLMSTMGYKADDIETALQMTNMNMNEAVELLNQSQRGGMGKFGGGGGVGVGVGGGEDFCEPGRALSGRFPPPPSHPQQQQTTGAINGSGLDNAQLLHIQKYLNQASNNPLASSQQGAAGGGINLNQLQAANQTTEPSIHQLRGLVQQIEMAVQAGYLNQQILNQPLSPQTVQLLSQLLNTIKHLPAPQNQISSQPSVFNKQQSVADFQRAQQQFDPLGSLQGNFSDLALSKNQKLPFVQAQATTQVQSRLNQWKLPPSVNPDNDMANFSRAPGTSTKPPNLTMNFSMNYEGPWSSEPNNASDGWPDIPEFEPGKPWKGPQIKTMEDDEM